MKALFVVYIIDVIIQLCSKLIEHRQSTYKATLDVAINVKVCRRQCPSILVSGT